MPSKKPRGIRAFGKTTVLCIDSTYEPITKTAFNYRSRHVYPYLRRKGFSTVPATRKNVLTEAQKSSVVYLTGVGHGSPDTYKGNGGQAVFKVGNYSQLVPYRKIVHFLSCQTAEKLGPDFVDNGCRAYFGYDEDFTFPMDSADAFLECDSAIDRGLAEGLTAGQVHDRARALFEKHIVLFRQNRNEYYATLLEFNRDHFRSPSSGPQWGQVNAKLG